MHWVLQRNLISPIDLGRFEDALTVRGAQYSLVTLVPFAHELASEPAGIPRNGVFVYGSTGMGTVAKARGWTPGYIDEGLDYPRMLSAYGARALNVDAVVAPLADLRRVWGRFFIRPCLDSKSFAGTVMTWPELEAFRDGVARAGDGASLQPTDQVVMAPLVDIAAEFRLFVVGGRVVASSRYKLGDRLSVSSEVPGEVEEFARACIDTWAPNAAFTLDIAVTPAGLKAIEVNSANSSGVYACDVHRIVAAVDEL